MNLKSLVALSLVTAAAPFAAAGPLAYAVCQTGCNTLVASCYVAASFTLVVSCCATAGLTIGMTIVGAPVAILACNTGLGICTAACATALIAPIP